MTQKKLQSIKEKTVHSLLTFEALKKVDCQYFYSVLIRQKTQNKNRLIESIITFFRTIKMISQENMNLDRKNECSTGTAPQLMMYKLNFDKQLSLFSKIWARLITSTQPSLLRS